MGLSQSGQTRGLIIGRFLPPHLGHELLIDFARHAVDAVDVLLCSLSREPIPGELRLHWMRESFPDANVVHITEEIPQARRGTAGATRIWADAVRSRLRSPTTHVFASESYGEELAAELGAIFVAVDPPRTIVPVSAAAIRRDPFAEWRYILPTVRSYFTYRVLVETDGGDAEAVARALAEELGTVMVPDYHRRLAGQSPGATDRIQRAAQCAAEARSDRIVVLCRACEDESLAADATVRVDDARAVESIAAEIRLNARPRHSWPDPGPA